MRPAVLALASLALLALPARAQLPGAACQAPLQVLAVLESPGEGGVTWRADVFNHNAVPVLATVQAGSTAHGVQWAAGQEARIEPRRSARLVIGQSPRGVPGREVQQNLQLACRTAR